MWTISSGINQWGKITQDEFSGLVKTPAAKQETEETQVLSLVREDPLEENRATHSSILAWEIPWTEEPGRLQSTGSQRVRCERLSTAHSRRWWEGRELCDLGPPSYLFCLHPLTKDQSTFQMVLFTELSASLGKGSHKSTPSPNRPPLAAQLLLYYLT